MVGSIHQTVVKKVMEGAGLKAYEANRAVKIAVTGIADSVWNREQALEDVCCPQCKQVLYRVRGVQLNLIRICCPNCRRDITFGGGM